MPKIGNYVIQSINFRGQIKLEPLYNLAVSITAEELDHVESRDDAL